MRSRLSGFPRQNPATPSRCRTSLATDTADAVCCRADTGYRINKSDHWGLHILSTNRPPAEHQASAGVTKLSLPSPVRAHEAALDVDSGEKCMAGFCDNVCELLQPFTWCRSCSILTRSKGATVLRLTTADMAPASRCAAYSRAPSRRACQKRRVSACRASAPRCCLDIPLSSGSGGCCCSCRSQMHLRTHSCVSAAPRASMHLSHGLATPLTWFGCTSHMVWLHSWTSPWCCVHACG